MTQEVLVRCKDRDGIERWMTPLELGLDMPAPPPPGPGLPPDSDMVMPEFLVGLKWKVGEREVKVLDTDATVWFYGWKHAGLCWIGVSIFLAPDVAIPDDEIAWEFEVPEGYEPVQASAQPALGLGSLFNGDKEYYRMAVARFSPKPGGKWAIHLNVDNTPQVLGKGGVHKRHGFAITSHTAAGVHGFTNKTWGTNDRIEFNMTYPGGVG